MDRRIFLKSSAITAVVAGAGLTAWAVMREGANYGAYSTTLRRRLDPHGGVPELIRMASLAPNGHNTQAWRFRRRGRTIVLSPDFSRRTPVVDPDDHHIYVSLGAAAENLAIAGQAMGMPGDLTIGGDIRYDWTPSRAGDQPLAEAIIRRQSTRSLYDGRPVDTATLNALAQAAGNDGVRLVLITEQPKLAAVRDLVVSGNDKQMSDPAFVAELKSWLRFSQRSAISHGDGLYSAASGNPSLPDFLGRIAFDFVVSKASEHDRYARQMKSSSGVAVFLGDRADPEHWMKVGRAQERFLLEATRRGLACAYVNQPVEVASLRASLSSLVGEKDLRPDLVIRFGRAPLMTYSPRRPVSDVMAA